MLFLSREWKTGEGKKKDEAKYRAIPTTRKKNILVCKRLETTLEVYVWTGNNLSNTSKARLKWFIVIVWQSLSNFDHFDKATSDPLKKLHLQFFGQQTFYPFIISFIFNKHRIRSQQLSVNQIIVHLQCCCIWFSCRNHWKFLGYSYIENSDRKSHRYEWTYLILLGEPQALIGFFSLYVTGQFWDRDWRMTGQTCQSDCTMWTWNQRTHMLHSDRGG